MRRFVNILLCICLLIVCAVAAWLGRQQLEPSTRLQSEDTAESLQQVSCTQLLNNIPGFIEEFELTGFHAGKRFVAIDRDEDGRWEQVFVPVFDRPLKDIRKNYRAIVICFAGVTDEVELRKRLQSDGLNAQYWPYSQKFEKETYSALAERYSSLDFERSIIIHCGFPKRAGIARYLFWGGAAGVFIAMLAIGWQSLDLIVISIRKSAAAQALADEENNKEDESKLMNRSGLPTIKRD